MNTIRSFLFLALSLSTLVVLVNAADDPDISPPDALAWIGAKHTCIESTAYEGKRCFYTYVPECAGEDAPLVFDIHGHSSLPFLSSVYTGWVTKATENCFVLVLPLVS
jgi:poly(3-hydroxybutyrate) depolymerase